MTTRIIHHFELRKTNEIKEVRSTNKLEKIVRKLENN